MRHSFHIQYQRLLSLALIFLTVHFAFSQSLVVIRYANGEVKVIHPSDFDHIEFIPEEDVPEALFDRRAFQKEDIPQGLPIVMINTVGSERIASKEQYLEGTSVQLFDENFDLIQLSEARIKGRGNSTWDMPKKPYKLKFGAKQEVYGMSADKEWVLLANYYDPTFLRNALTFYMADEIGNFGYTPRFQTVSLILNGEYAGLYQIGESLKTGKKRVNVGDDGFLLEIDAKADSLDPTFHVPNLYFPINIKDPDVVVGDKDYLYIQDRLSAIDSILYCPQWLDEQAGYRSVIDDDSFVDWYIVNEISKNNDACFYTSCYMHLKRDGKLHMGPLWDYDLAYGNVDYNGNDSTAGFWIKDSGYYRRLFQDSLFVEKVRTRFNAYYDSRQKLYDFLDAQASLLTPSALADARIWGISVKNGLHRKKDAESLSDDEIVKYYETQVSNLKDWLESRFKWLKGALI